MKKTALSVLIVLSLLSGSVFAQQKDIKLSIHEKNKRQYLYNTFNLSSSSKYNKLELADKLLAEKIKSKDLNISKVKNNVLQVESKKKSILTGILLSAFIPGAGEFYAKSYIKSAIFLAIEAISWGAYAHYQSKGNTQTESFQNYADTYWSVRKYANWLKSEGFPNSIQINPDEPNLETLRNQIMICESSNFSHTMPVYHSQQYYELIGKYQNFQAGWTNLSHEPTRAQGPYWFETYKDQVFIDYANERQKANDYYNYAKTGIFVVVFNHILSAADAAWSVSIFNKNLKMQTGFDIKRYKSPFTGQVGNLPSVNLNISF